MTSAFYPPSREQIIAILSAHPLIKLRERVQRAYLVGSFAKEALGVGSTHEQSDVDILLEVVPRNTDTTAELEESYRNPLRSYFMRHNLRGKHDEVHPQWCGRRVDLYFAYDADLEARPKIELLSQRAVQVDRASESQATPGDAPRPRE